MSSTSNVQNLLVNVVRPTYRWESGTGFVPSVVMSNVTELIAGKVITNALVVSDSNVNTFIGSNAGCNATTSFNNVGIGFQAMAGIVNADSNVAVGSLALEGFSNGSNNTVIGAGADISADVDSNIIIGTNTQITGGSNSIVIGNGITWSTGDSLNIKNSIYGSNGRIGIGTVVPSQPLDVSGLAYFRDKVGIQVLNPTYSLDVLGTAYATTRFLTGVGSTPTTPAYSFCNVTTTGLYQTSDASYGSGALGVSILGTPRVVVSGTKTYIYGDLDVCGAFSAVSGGGGGGGGGTIASNGTAAAPSFTFSNDASTGLHLGGTSYLAFDTSGVQRMVISDGNVGIGQANPAIALDVLATDACLRLQGTATSPSDPIASMLYPNMTNGTQGLRRFGRDNGQSNAVNDLFNYVSDGNASNYYRIYIIGQNAGTGLHWLANGRLGINTASPSTTLDVNGTTQSSNFRGGAGTVATPTYAFTSDTNTGLHSAGTSQLAFDTAGVQRMIISNADVGIGTASPVCRLDVCGSAGSPSINVRTWPRIPLSNALLVKGVPGDRVGTTLNFNTVVRTINSGLATFVASNASVGSSFLINKAGIWSIMLVGSTGNGTQLWMDVSTDNTASNNPYANGSPVLSIAYTPGSGTSNNTTCTFMGFLPSNIYVKPRINGSLGADGDTVWRFNALFHAETDEVSTWPF